MKRLLLIVCAVLSLETAVRADILIPYQWTTEPAGSGFDRFLLTVMPQGAWDLSGPVSGVSILGFNVLVYDSLFRNLFSTGGLPTFKEVKDLDTSFLLNIQHGGFTDPTVDDLVVIYSYEEANSLIGGFTVAAGGAYKDGWSAPLDLLEILVPTGTVFLSQLILSQDIDTPSVVTNKGPGYLVNSPEPGTCVLLATGFMGFAGYCWRRRQIRPAVR
jgi:hypothetical protein